MSTRKQLPESELNCSEIQTSLKISKESSEMDKCSICSYTKTFEAIHSTFWNAAQQKMMFSSCKTRFTFNSLVSFVLLYFQSIAANFILRRPDVFIPHK